MDKAWTVGGSNSPKWMVPPGFQSDEDKYADVRSWSELGVDPSFRVSLHRLDELLNKGYWPVPNYYFTVVGLPGDPIVPRLNLSNLGQDVHARVTAEASEESVRELDLASKGVGGVANWSNGFPQLLSYLREAENLTGISVADLVIEGRPGEPLLRDARTGILGQLAPAVEDVSASAKAEQIRQSLNNDVNVIVEGVAGSGKSHLVKDLKRHYPHVRVVVFHPSSSYEEFVSGLRPTTDGRFHGRAGVFVEACRNAAAAPHENFLFFIDEINRANTSRVFGDMLLLIEKSKRVDFTSNELTDALFVEEPKGVTSIRLQTPVNEDGLELSYLVVPSNLHVLGTMNSTDRSVGTIDLALRRRFTWTEMEPLTASELQKDSELQQKLNSAVESADDWNQIIDWFGSTNNHLFLKVGPDSRLGHAHIFAASTPETAARALVSQLAEIAFVFNLSEEVLQEVAAIELAGTGTSLTVSYVGRGLGRRPRVREQPLATEGQPLPIRESEKEESNTPAAWKGQNSGIAPGEL